MADEQDQGNAGVARGRRSAASAGRASDRRLAALKAERDDYYDRLLRKTAEFDNYRKRVERERREQADQSVVDLLLELLLVVDDFDRALTSRRRRRRDAYRKGVELIHAKLHDLLKQAGRQPDRGARRRLRSERASGGGARRESRRIARAK